MLFLDEELTLSTTDRYIYDYVCKNLDRVVYMRVRELAEACSVSPSTVMRFCERFGCKGYSEFRFRLQEYAAKRGVEAAQPYDVSADISFLEQMRRNVYEREFSAAKAIIDTSDILFFVGVGASGIAARYGQYYFSSFVGPFGRHYASRRRARSLSRQSACGQHRGNRPFGLGRDGGGAGFR